MQWVHELGAFRRMTLEQLEVANLTREFVNRAIAEGVERDTHEWRGVQGFEWDVRTITRMQQEEEEQVMRELGEEIELQAVMEEAARRDGEVFEGPNGDVVHNIVDDEMQGYSALQTVDKNKEGFTKKQVKRAEIARSGYHMLGAIDPKLFKMALCLTCQPRN